MSPPESQYDRKELTDRLLRSLKVPEQGRLEVSDTKRLGLKFRLSSSGKAKWMYEKRVKGGVKRKHTLGAWPDPVSLSEARAMALEIEAEASKGIDRVAIAEVEKLENETAISTLLTLRDVFQKYDNLHLSTLRRGKERRIQLEQALSAHLDQPISALSRAHLQAAVDAKASEGRKTSANRIRAALLAFSGWAWGRSYISSDIGAGIPKATKETARERVPSIEEVRRVWSASYEMGEMWGPAIRLMILTAQRRGEILGLLWSEIDLNRAQIIKPGSRTKNGKPHTTHLSPPALVEIKLMKAQLDDGERDRNDMGLLFTTTGRTPPSGVSKAKLRLDRHLGDDFTPWHLHDLRTSFSTAMVEAGVPESVTDRILNHSASSSASSTVARVYNQAEQLPQRAAALDRWAEMVTDKSGKVVRLTSGHDHG